MKSKKIIIVDSDANGRYETGIYVIKGETYAALEKEEALIRAKGVSFKTFGNVTIEYKNSQLILTHDEGVSVSEYSNIHKYVKLLNRMAALSPTKRIATKFMLRELKKRKIVMDLEVERKGDKTVSSDKVNTYAELTVVIKELEDYLT